MSKELEACRCCGWFSGCDCRTPSPEVEAVIAALTKRLDEAREALKKAPNLLRCGHHVHDAPFESMLCWTCKVWQALVMTYPAAKPEAGEL